MCCFRFCCCAAERQLFAIFDSASQAAKNQRKPMLYYRYAIAILLPLLLIRRLFADDATIAFTAPERHFASMLLPLFRLQLQILWLF
jgi:hypothetical protein